MNKAPLYSFTAVVFAASMFIMSCSSSGSSSASTTNVNGLVYAAQVDGASVEVIDKNGNVVAGPVSTASDGSYSVTVPNTALSSDLRFISTGGTYVDEATGASTPAGTLSAFVSAGTLTTGSVNIDPFTTIVCDLVTNYSMTVGQAQGVFNNAFGFTPDTSVAPSNAPSNGSNTPGRLEAFYNGVFSQLISNMTYTPGIQGELIAAIASNLANDGLMSGSTGSIGGTLLPADIQSLYDNAIVSYLSNTTANLTGITPADIGNLPVANVVLTQNYSVEYIPGMTAAQMGETQFQIQIANLSGGTPATGLASTITLMPMMNMAGMQHTAPVDVVSESTTTPGTYNCTVYYLMQSGPGIGFWELQVMIGMMGDVATFYPAVGMPMGTDTMIYDLQGGSDDTIASGMTGSTPRTYMLFNDGLVMSGPTATFDLFVATEENMMDMPAVSVGTVLTSPTGTWEVTSESMLASMDPTFSSGVVPGIDIGASGGPVGHWSIPFSSSSLMSGMTNTIYIQYTVNGEVKTSGLGASQLPYATFLVTPQGTSGM